MVFGVLYLVFENIKKSLLDVLQNSENKRNELFSLGLKKEDFKSIKEGIKIELSKLNKEDKK